MAERIGFLGIGAMGRPMAANLVRKGFDVAVLVHRRPEPVRALEAIGARVTGSLAALIKDCPVVIACLPTSAEVEATVLAPGGVLESGRPGGVFVDMGTSRPASTRMLAARLRERGIAMVDAPITGGVHGATEGTLTIYVGGAAADVARVRPALDAMGRTILHMGDIGAGHVTKLLNNMISLSSMALLAEALSLGVRAGLGAAELVGALSAGSAAAPMLQARGARILKGEFAPSFQIALAHKDLRLAQELAQEYNLPVPAVTGALATYTMARGFGLDAEDTVATVKVWERIAGVEVRQKP
jgi:3-hydroxyisobutyrate dehydrogenase-like beta-hydroxyacid dehydrogenase